MNDNTAPVQPQSTDDTTTQPTQSDTVNSLNKPGNMSSINRLWNEPVPQNTPPEIQKTPTEVQPTVEKAPKIITAEEKNKSDNEPIIKPYTAEQKKPDPVVDNTDKLTSLHDVKTSDKLTQFADDDEEQFITNQEAVHGHK